MNGAISTILIMVGIGLAGRGAGIMIVVIENGAVVEHGLI
jgi:hypothetical protein